MNPNGSLAVFNASCALVLSTSVIIVAKLVPYVFLQYSCASLHGKGSSGTSISSSGHVVSEICCSTASNASSVKSVISIILSPVYQ